MSQHLYWNPSHSPTPHLHLNCLKILMCVRQAQMMTKVILNLIVVFPVVLFVSSSSFLFFVFYFFKSIIYVRIPIWRPGALSLNRTWWQLSGIISWDSKCSAGCSQASAEREYTKGECCTSVMHVLPVYCRPSAGPFWSLKNVQIHIHLNEHFAFIIIYY